MVDVKSFEQLCYYYQQLTEKFPLVSMMGCVLVRPTASAETARCIAERSTRFFVPPGMLLLRQAV